MDTSIQGKGHFFWVPNPVFNFYSVVTLQAIKKWLTTDKYRR